VDLAGYLAILRRRGIAIALCLIAGLCGGYYAGHHGAKTFRASARVLVNIPAARTLQDQLAGAQLSGNLVNTYAAVVTSRAVAQRVAESLGLPQGPDAVAKALSASAEPNTYLIDIAAHDASPQQAQALANAAAAGLQKAVAGLQSGVGDRVSVQIVDLAAVPTTPVSPRPALNLALGGVLGLLAGVVVAALLEALDRTVKTVAEVNRLLALPLVGLVPRRREGTLVVSAQRRGPEGEVYRSMRTALRFLDPDRPLRSLLVTSPTAADGKTTTAANLAVALALSGERVILLDADLRRANLAEVFGLERAVGLTSIVVGDASLDEALQPWHDMLDVLPAGQLPPNPSEILGSQTFNDILTELTDIADIVIIDAPPVLPVTDAVAVSAQVDGVLLVTRYGLTLRQSAAEAHRRMQAVGANVVGYVLNAVPVREARGYYATYGYEDSERKRPAVVPAARARERTPADAATASAVATTAADGRVTRAGDRSAAAVKEPASATDGAEAVGAEASTAPARRRTTKQPAAAAPPRAP
jgi:succinoglycan biosynthesis transport protein ExoP